MSSYYKAKFEREAKDRPVDWLIVGARSGQLRLAHVEGPKMKRKQSEIPSDVPAWLQGVMLAAVFGFVLFADAIAVWLS